MVNWFLKFIKKKPGEAGAAEGKKAEQEAPQPSCGIEEFRKLFVDDDTFMTREFLCGGKKCCIAFVNGMVDTVILNLHVVEPLMRAAPPAGSDALQWLMDNAITSADVQRHKELGSMAEEFVSGDAICFLEGSAGALTFNTRKWATRGITEPESEKASKGPREGFNESLITNLTLIRRKLGTPDLKIKFRRIGTRSNTRACVMYLQGLADQSVLDELDRRLNAIEIDGILAVNYIDELIRDSPASVFSTLGTTERPDVVAAKLLEGRVALMMEGTPTALTLPYIFIEYFQTVEDYTNNFWMASIARIMRIIGYILTLTVPAVYLALVSMHQEMVPTDLLLAINASRQQVPLPAVLEIIIMLIVVEIMRESGARVPSFLGQSLSIVGGLVIGQAAVEARLVSAPVVIVVALTAITSLLIPKIEGAAFILRIGFLLITSVLGFYGLMIGMTAMFIHLLGIRSFGVPYLSAIFPLNMQEFKDTAIRMPWYYMVLRPRHISKKDSVRQSGRKV
jgi:spore germination protein KA